MTQFYLQITTLPPGEAPEWVRQCWIGLSLPINRTSPPARRYRTFGVVTGPRTLAARLWALVRNRADLSEGYAVDAALAVAILESVHPEAAHWWKVNAPHMLKPGREFLSHKQVGTVV